MGVETTPADPDGRAATALGAEGAQPLAGRRDQGMSKDIVETVGQDGEAGRPTGRPGRLEAVASLQAAVALHHHGGRRTEPDRLGFAGATEQQ